jgi:uncharacterized protein YprB with RNaseH-like and TPR domain
VGLKLIRLGVHSRNAAVAGCGPNRRYRPVAVRHPSGKPTIDGEATDIQIERLTTANMTALAFVDIETTGLSPTADVITEVDGGPAGRL